MTAAVRNLRKWMRTATRRELEQALLKIFLRAHNNVIELEKLTPGYIRRHPETVPRHIPSIVRLTTTKKLGEEKQ